MTIEEVADKVEGFVTSPGMCSQVSFRSSLASIDLDHRVSPITNLDLGRMR